MPRRHLYAVVLLAILLGGCGRSSVAPPPTTGSPEVVRAYFEALLQKDWAKAYEQLHPDQRVRFTLMKFTQSAQNYRRQIGFEPRSLYVRSCEEQGEEAIAHVVYDGEQGGKTKFHKDAVTLRLSANGWGVVLPPKFG